MELTVFVQYMKVKEAISYFEKLGYEYSKYLSSSDCVYMDKWGNGKGERVRIVKGKHVCFDIANWECDKKSYSKGVWIESLEFYAKPRRDFKSRKSKKTKNRKFKSKVKK